MAFAGFLEGHNLSLFINSLTAKDARVRAEAASVLGEMGDERAVPALCQVLATDQNPEVRLSAAEALGMIGSEEIQKSLGEA